MIQHHLSVPPPPSALKVNYLLPYHRAGVLDLIAQH